MTNSPCTYGGLRQEITQLTEKFLFALIGCSKFVDSPHASFRTSVVFNRPQLNPSDFFSIERHLCG